MTGTDHRRFTPRGRARKLVVTARALPWRGLASPAQVWAARQRAAGQDASLAEILVADGVLSARDMQAALAAHHGVARYDPARHTLALDGIAQADVATCLKHALAPARNGTGAPCLLVARLDRLDQARAALPLDWQDAPPVLIAEDTVQTLLARAFREDLTRRASARVPAHESCRTWGHAPARRTALTMAALAVASALLLVYPAQVITALVLWASFTLLVASLHKTAAVIAHLAAPQPPAQARNADPLPRVSVLVPLFRERDIAQTLVARLSRLTYPKALLDVVLVLEETDTQTHEALASTTLPPWMRVIVAPDGQPRTKPRAMNYALDFCRGDIIGIWDAEDAPDPDQIDRVAARFAQVPPDVVCLQGVLDYYNPRQNWMARCFTLEYATWFRLVLPGMARLGFAIPLGGTTLFFRRDALEALGGWDAHNVTEDADLGFRLARHGYRTEMIATTTGEEANCHVRPWIKQRSRWLKGYMVTWLVHMRRPLALARQMGWWRFFGMQTHFITALSQFLLAPLLWSLWLILLGLPHPVEGLVPGAVLGAMGVLFLVVEGLTMGAAVIANRGPDHRHLIPWVPTLHFYFALGCLAAYKALWELIVAPFYWDKTSHGHSLTQTETATETAPAPVAYSTPFSVPESSLSRVTKALEM